MFNLPKSEENKNEKSQVSRRFKILREAAGHDPDLETGDGAGGHVEDQRVIQARRRFALAPVSLSLKP